MKSSVSGGTLSEKITQMSSELPHLGLETTHYKTEGVEVWSLKDTDINQARMSNRKTLSSIGPSVCGALRIQGTTVQHALEVIKMWWARCDDLQNRCFPEELTHVSAGKKNKTRRHSAILRS